MKFVLFVEGHTEKLAVPQFLKRWLDPRLARPVGIKVSRFEGWNEYARDIRQKVELNLSGKSGSDVIAGIGLLDLYGPTIYPAELADVASRLAWAKEHFERLTGHPRFRQHFAVHELEAWLLAEPAVLPRAVREALPIDSTGEDQLPGASRQAARPPLHQQVEQALQEDNRRNESVPGTRPRGGLREMSQPEAAAR